VAIPQAVRIARIYRGRRQGEITGYSQQMISAIERGERAVAPDAAPMLAQQLDHPALYAELSRELTGVGPAWLDGAAVDLHRASVREKAIEELREAMAAIERWPAARPPDSESEGARRDRYSHLLQVYDAMVACFAYLGVQCLEYGYSMLQLSRDHYRKLKSKRYVAGETEAPRTGRGSK
jgi:transcriptional regulator with XRE-family HTH domain